MVRGFQLHYVTSSENVRRKRVFDRNIEQEITYSLEVTPAIYAHTEKYLSSTVGSELEDAIVVEN
jgi:hypothetical protein